MRLPEKVRFHNPHVAVARRMRIVFFDN